MLNRVSSSLYWYIEGFQDGACCGEPHEKPGNIIMYELGYSQGARQLAYHTHKTREELENADRTVR